MGNGITISKKQLPGVPPPPGARKIVVIPYQKWIYHDARRFGHFNQFSTDPACEITTTNNNTILSVLPSLSSSSFSTPTSFVSTSLSLTNDFILQTKSQSALGPPALPFSMNRSTVRSNHNNPSASALVGSAMTLSSSSSTVTCASATPSHDSDSRRLHPKPIYYVNGRFFKSLTRLGDAQFILSEHGEDDTILTVPSNIERYRTNDNTVRERIHRLNRVIACCDEFLVFQLWKGNNEVEIFVFDRPVQTDKYDRQSSTKKCTCFHRQSQRPQSTSISADRPTPDISELTTTPTNITRNRHSSLMQTAALSSYQPGDFVSPITKPCSLLNETDQRFDVANNTYEFVDSTKKVSYLTGSARGTLVTTSAALTAATNPTHTNTHSPTNTAHHLFAATMSRIRFGKSAHRWESLRVHRNSFYSLVKWNLICRVLFSSSTTVNTRSYSVSNTNEPVNCKSGPNLIYGSKHRSVPYLSTFSCNCMDHHESVLLSSSASPPCSLSSSSSTWNSRIVRKLNSVAHRFNARSYACLISPDRTKLLITPDYEDKHSYSHQIHEVTVVFDIKTYAILRITPARKWRGASHSCRARVGSFRVRSTLCIRSSLRPFAPGRIRYCSWSNHGYHQRPRSCLFQSHVENESVPSGIHARWTPDHRSMYT